MLAAVPRRRRRPSVLVPSRRMRTGLTILAGLLAGGLVAIGVLAALVFVGPDPVGLGRTPPPAVAPSAEAAASPSAAASPPASPGASAWAGSSGSAGPSGSAGSASPAASPSGSSNVEADFHVGQPAPALAVPQVGGGTIDLATLRGKAVWVNFLQTTCQECSAVLPVMDGFKARYEKDGLVVIAVDVREDEATVAAFAARLKTSFPIGLDRDGAVQRAWGSDVLPMHFWIDGSGVVQAGAVGEVSPDVMAASLRKILPGVNVTP
jgi:peroxiredoxin